MIIKELVRTIPQVGTVDFISIRPVARGPVEKKDSVEVSIEEGLIGDHYGRASGKRQVTLIQSEHLEAVAKLLGKENVDPALTRRNIVVSGVNLLAFKDLHFQIGDVVLEFTGLCYPCSRMEQNLGHGGYNAMRGHGGITTRVIKGGTIKLGDEVKLIDLEE
ncbi:MAG: MOSC domain-containing protein [Bacteroidota bacterium]